MAWTSRFPVLLALTLVGAAPLTAHAISVDCSDPSGMCTVSNDGMDWTSCDCADGSGVGGGGGNEWAGLGEAEMLLECQDALASFCGPPVPPDGISCETPEGTCTVSNENGDSVFCECEGVPAGGGTGGNDWAGLDDDQLYEVCLDMVEDFCVAAGTGTTDPTGVTDSGDPTETDTGATDAGTSAETGNDDAGSSGDTGSTDDSGGATTGDTGGASSDGPGGGSGDDTGTTGDASATAGDASATAGDASATAGDASATAADSGDTGEGPGQDILQSGCGCTTGATGRGGPLAVAIGMLIGAIGRRRRR